MIIKRIREGEMTPWYYSRVYYDYLRCQDVVAVVPLCYAILLFYQVRDAWYRFRGRPTWIDVRIKESMSASYLSNTQIIQSAIDECRIPKDTPISSKDTSKAFSRAIKLLEESRNEQIMNDKLDEVLDES